MDFKGAQIDQQILIVIKHRYIGIVDIERIGMGNKSGLARIGPMGYTPWVFLP